ncbi:NAD(P)H oxidoreductase [Nonomuraea longicatena]
MNKTALLVVSHPRATSLTQRAAVRARRRLEREGYSVDLLDLYAEGFDPRMPLEDEPDWGYRDKVYSAEVRRHMSRIEAADLIVVIFPIWWFGLPAMLKGWIDRVWNYGLSYGRREPRLRGKRMVWVGLGGYSEQHFTGGGWDATLTRTLKVGISEFNGIEDVDVRLIYGTVPGGEVTNRHAEDILHAAEVAVVTKPVNIA